MSKIQFKVERLIRSYDRRLKKKLNKRSKDFLRKEIEFYLKEDRNIKTKELMKKSIKSVRIIAKTTNLSEKELPKTSKKLFKLAEKYLALLKKARPGHKIKILNEMSKISIKFEDLGTKKLELKVDEIFIPINKNNIETIVKDISTKIKENENVMRNSSKIIYEIERSKEIELVEKDIIASLNTDGNFFPFYNGHDEINLERYQIYKEDEYNTEEINDEHCLVNALRLSKVENDGLRRMIGHRHFPRNKLGQVAKLLEININLHEYKMKKGTNTYKKVKKVYKGSQNNEYVDIALYNSHYFIYETTIYHEFAIRNQDLIKNEYNKWEISGFASNKRTFRRNKKGLNSLKLIHLMKELNYFKKPIDECIHFNDDEDYISDFSGICKKIKKKFGKSIKNKHIVFADIETVKNGNEPIAIEIGYEINKIKIETIIGLNCCKVFLDRLAYIATYLSKRKTVLVYFHNLKFDFSFIMKMIQLIVHSVEKDSSAYQFTCIHGGVRFIFRDLWKIIPLALKNFTSFGIDIEKDVMPYDYYTLENYKKKFGDIEEALKYIEKDEDKKKFLSNIKKLDIEKDGKFNMHKYCTYYLKKDVIVMRKGYYKFKKIIKDNLDLDIEKFLSISSIADAYMIKKGCYDGCYTISGNYRRFIMKCIYGGRVMSKHYLKHLITDKKISDFDACSLYPSSINRMKGFPKGKPTGFYGDYIKKYDMYFVEVKITKVGKILDFPIIPYRQKDGSVIYSNKIRNQSVYVDKYMLEDIVNFHKAEYKIIRGVGFDQGFNDKCKEVMRGLYDLRLKYKKQNNKAQLVIKLIMNAIYGKTIVKASNVSIVYKNSRAGSNRYISKNYNRLYRYSEWQTGKHRFKVHNQTLTHANRPHIGCNVLSMSKRIMNEVMVCAQDNGIEIYYQDTDSMHMDYDKIDQLSQKFKEKYGRQLVGGYMHQFHNDFNHGDYSEFSCILGKKCYLDIVYDIKTGKRSPHIRMKGIPHQCIINQASNIEELKKMYIDLYEGKTKEFDLVKDSNKPNFRWRENMSIYYEDDLKRKISFRNKKSTEVLSNHYV
jgi:hypothetical protein